MSDFISREDALVRMDELCKGVACIECPFCISSCFGGCKVFEFIKTLPTIKAYTIEDLRDAYRDGQDNECSYHWGVRKAEPGYMKDEVTE